MARRGLAVARVGAVLVVLLGTGCGMMARPTPTRLGMSDSGFSRIVETARLDGKVAGVATVAPASFAKPADQADQSVRLPNQMIIRTGQVSIQVDSLERAVQQVTDLATRFGGYVANSSISTGENSARTATIEVKVPTERYGGTLDGMKAIGTVRSASTATEDVGEEFVDVTARMTNARRLEDRLLTVLATRTGKLEEVLGVERELARVREEIERYEGRLRYLKAQVSMSTLAVTVFEPGPIVGAPGENVIVAAFEAAWRNFVGVFAGAIALAGGIVPIVVLAGLVLLGIRPWLRRARPHPPAA